MVDPRPVRTSARTLARILLALQIVLGILLGLSVAGLALVGVLEGVRAALAGMLVDALGHPEVVARPGQAMALMGIVVVQVALLLAVTERMRAIFTGVAALDPEGAAQAARQTSWGLWVLVGWGVLAGALGSVIATWHFPEGERILAVGIGSPQVTTALAALFAAFMARAFVLGAELWRDHEAVI